MARFVLVHGGFSGAWIWLPLMDRLKAAGHLVEAFDLPGMGDDHTSASEVALDSYADRVCEVLAANSEPASWSATASAALSQRKERHDVPNVSRHSYTWRPSCQRTGRVFST